MNKKTVIWSLIAGIIVGTIVDLSVLLYQAEHGDLNHDGKVNTLDLSNVLGHWTKN